VIQQQVCDTAMGIKYGTILSTWDDRLLCDIAPSHTSKFMKQFLKSMKNTDVNVCQNRKNKYNSYTVF
jgi:hypothetical protein